MGIESRDDFRCGTQHDRICFPGGRRNLHRKLCCSDLSVSVAYFYMEGRLNFPSVLVETGRKYAFLIYLLHPALSDLLKKCSESLGVSNCQIYFWLRPVLVYVLTVVTVSCISAVSAYARQNILQNNHV